MLEISELQRFTSFPVDQIYSIIRGEIPAPDEGNSPDSGEGDLVIHPLAYLPLNLDRAKLQAVFPQAACLMLCLTECNHVCLCLHDQLFQEGEDAPDPIWCLNLEKLSCDLFSQTLRLSELLKQEGLDEEQIAACTYSLLRKLLTNRKMLKVFALADPAKLPRIAALFVQQTDLSDPIPTHRVPC